MILKTKSNLWIALASIIIASTTFAGPLGYKEGRWLLKAKESYFSTSSNFDKDGIKKELTNGQSLTLLTTSISATYDINDKISLFSVLDLVYGKSVGVDFSRTRFTPTDLKLGGDFLLFSSIRARPLPARGPQPSGPGEPERRPARRLRAGETPAQQARRPASGRVDAFG